MNEKEIKKVLNIYKNKIYKNIDDKEELERILNKIQRLKKQIDKDDIRIDELIALTFYLLNNYDESLKIYKRLIIIKTTSKYYLGIHKNYVAKENLEQIITSYSLYKTSLKEKLDMYNSTLIDAILNYIHNNLDFNITYHDKYGFFDLSTNSQLLIEYNKLIELINKKKFSQAISLCELLESFAKENHLNVEFFTLKKLLGICKEQKRKRINDNMTTIYNDLKIAVNTSDINKIISTLYDIKDHRIKDKNLITQALYLLIQNNYLNEAAELINDIDFDKNFKEQIKILKIAINEMNHLNNLNQNQLQVYNESIEKGNYHYHNYDLEIAYNYYTWGLYATDAPIFYYYIGKVYYKSNMYKDAMYYFNQYIKLGTTKINKAYLYLSKISEKYKKEKKSINYSKHVKMCNKLFGQDYDFYSLYEEESDNYKINMQRILEITETFFTNGN